MYYLLSFDLFIETEENKMKIKKEPWKKTASLNIPHFTWFYGVLPRSRNKQTLAPTESAQLMRRVVAHAAATAPMGGAHGGNARAQPAAGMERAKTRRNVKGARK